MGRGRHGRRVPARPDCRRRRGVYFVSRHVSTERSTSADAIRAFDGVKASFPGSTRRSTSSTTKNGRTMPRPFSELPTSPTRPEHLRMLAWDPDEERLIKISLPFWILRMHKAKLDVGAGEGFDLGASQSRRRGARAHRPGARFRLSRAGRRRVSSSGRSSQNAGKFPSEFILRSTWQTSCTTGSQGGCHVSSPCTGRCWFVSASRPRLQRWHKLAGTRLATTRVINAVSRRALRTRAAATRSSSRTKATIAVATRAIARSTATAIAIATRSATATRKAIGTATATMAAVWSPDAAASRRGPTVAMTGTTAIPNNGYDPAYQTGLNDGYEAGLDDGRDNRRFDPVSKRRYPQCRSRLRARIRTAGSLQGELSRRLQSRLPARLQRRPPLRSAIRLGGLFADSGLAVSTVHGIQRVVQV